MLAYTWVKQHASLHRLQGYTTPKIIPSLGKHIISQNAERTPGIERSYTEQIVTEAISAKHAMFGQPQNVLKLEKHNIPAPTSGQVLVKMLMAPINPSDLNMIEGTYPILPLLPAVGGNEGVGKVIQVGSAVKRLKINDYVIPAKSGLGTWTSHLIAEEDHLSVVDKTIPPDFLACLAINPCTALRLLNDFVKLERGDVIIQNGANSMVGSVVIQLAAARGIKTINIIRERPDQADIIEKLKVYGGYIVDTENYLNTPEFRRLISDLPKPKLALNGTGGPIVAEMARLLDHSATLVTYGAMSRKPLTFPSSLFLFKDLRLRGFWLSKWLDDNSLEEREKMQNEMAQMFKEGKLRVWTERHSFTQGFLKGLERAQSERKERKVLLEF